MYLLDVCSLRKVPVSVEERDRLQPKLTCSAQKRIHLRDPLSYLDHSTPNILANVLEFCCQVEK